MIIKKHFNPTKKSAIFRYKKNSGFTLIELLMVIAIIGLLAALSIVKLNEARYRAYDAQIKNDLSQFRSFATARYDNGVYTSDGTADGVDMTIADAGIDLKPPDCSDDDQYNVFVSDDGKSYVIWADLCTTDGDFCIDSTGQAVVLSCSAEMAGITFPDLAGIIACWPCPKPTY